MIIMNWAKEISIQTVEGAACFLAAFSKMLEERNKLKERLKKKKKKEIGLAVYADPHHSR